MRRWEEIFLEEDRELLKRADMAKKQDFGGRPSLLVVDVIKGVFGTVEIYPTSCGRRAEAALPHIEKVVNACRAVEIPVVFIKEDLDAWRFTQGPTKEATPEWMTAHFDEESNEIPEQIKPRPSELVIPKIRASCFFGTSLLSCLRTMGIDTLLVVGGATSGCLRATVVDAFSNGYRCFVVEECCIDRFELSHLVNLWDMNAKYADVITVDEALELVTKFAQSRKGA